ncbi:MAG: MBL fold metallo-hydrolase [Syntrophorhabdaceae bacterium]|nr:MBL fold metallo-hydrolase [Syntrophorhabdaceae bacterium]
MNVKILGTGTSIPSLKRLSSSYLVTTKGYRILIDVGPSVVRRLLEFDYSVNDIDLIIITHFHVDHTADLSTFLFACNYGIEPRRKPLLLIGGPGSKKFFKGLSAIYPWVLPNFYKLTLKVLARGIYNFHGISIETVRVNHNSESIAIKISHEKSVVFSGDTSYSRNLSRFFNDADLLITECSFPERKVKGHLNLAMLQRIVDEARPKRVILSHLYPDWDDFKGVLHEPFLLAEDGMEIEL